MFNYVKIGSVFLVLISFLIACSSPQQESIEEKKDSAASSIQKRIDTIENKMIELKAKAEAKGDQVKSETREKIADLEKSLQNAKEQLKDLGKVSEDIGEQAQEKVEKVVKDIENGINELTEEFE